MTDLFDHLYAREKDLGVYTPPPEPFAYVQMKGTMACMDVHCKCGHHSHIDDEFVYYVECSKCSARYAVHAYFRLIELPEDLHATVQDHATGFNVGA